MNRVIREENLDVLTRRWKTAVSDPMEASKLFHLDDASVAALRQLNQVDIERLADVATPLFDIADPVAVINLLAQARIASALGASQAQMDVLGVENEIILVNRWLVAQSGDLSHAIEFGMSEALMQALTQATLRQIQAAARSGHLCVRARFGRAYLTAGQRLQTASVALRNALAMVQRGPLPLGAWRAA